MKHDDGRNASHTINIMHASGCRVVEYHMCNRDVMEMKMNMKKGKIYT